jgi:hypothetical protein
MEPTQTSIKLGPGSSFARRKSGWDVKLIIHILLAQNIKQQRRYTSTGPTLIRVFRQQKDTWEMWRFKYDDYGGVLRDVSPCDYQTFRKITLLSSSGYSQVIFKLPENLSNIYSVLGVSVFEIRQPKCCGKFSILPVPPLTPFLMASA